MLGTPACLEPRPTDGKLFRRSDGSNVWSADHSFLSYGGIGWCVLQRPLRCCWHATSGVSTTRPRRVFLITLMCTITTDRGVRGIWSASFERIDEHSVVCKRLVCSAGVPCARARRPLGPGSSPPSPEGFTWQTLYRREIVTASQSFGQLLPPHPPLPPPREATDERLISRPPPTRHQRPPWRPFPG